MASQKEGHCLCVARRDGTCRTRVSIQQGGAAWCCTSSRAITCGSVLVRGSPSPSSRLRARSAASAASTQLSRRPKARSCCRTLCCSNPSSLRRKLPPRPTHSQATEPPYASSPSLGQEPEEDSGWRIIKTNCGGVRLIHAGDANVWCVRERLRTLISCGLKRPTITRNGSWRICAGGNSLRNRPSRPELHKGFHPRRRCNCR